MAVPIVAPFIRLEIVADTEECGDRVCRDAGGPRGQQRAPGAFPSPMIWVREVLMASSRHAPGRAALGRALHGGFAALLLTGAGWSAAHAQGFYREVYGPPRGYVVEDEDLLRPREIVEGLRDRGFTEVSRPRYDGRAYRVEATGPRGLRVRLVVDARDGEVIGREPLGAAYYPSDRPRPAAASSRTVSRPPPAHRRTRGRRRPADSGRDGFLQHLPAIRLPARSRGEGCRATTTRRKKRARPAGRRHGRRR